MVRRFVDEDDDEQVTIEGVRVERQTDLALLCVWTQGKRAREHWIPKSQVTDDSEVWEPGHSGKLVITGWYARKEDLA